MERHEYNVFADYHQFYLQDETVDGDLGDSWTAEATARLLALAPGTVGIGTVRNMDVPVVVEVWASEPPLDGKDWDMINECALQVDSGQIVVAGCTDYFPEAARIPVLKGTYSVRVLYEGLDSISEDGLEGNDRYMIQLWRDKGRNVRTIKSWKPR